MTNYSIQSIFVSGERTKANYLTNVIVEDVIGSAENNTSANDNFSNLVSQNEFNSDFCQSNTGGTNNNGEIYYNAVKLRVLYKFFKNRSVLFKKDFWFLFDLIKRVMDKKILNPVK